MAIARVDKSANDHDAGHLAVRAGGRLQRNAGQAGDFREVLLKFVDNFQRALRLGFRSQRVKIRKAGDARHLFVQPRVVFHRARTQRIHAQID